LTEVSRLDTSGGTRDAFRNVPTSGILKAAIVVGAEIVYNDHKCNMVEIIYDVLAAEIYPDGPECKCK